jgi:hypothetical protein
MPGMGPMPGMGAMEGEVGVEGGAGVEGVVGASFIGIFTSFIETQQFVDWLADASAFIPAQQSEWGAKGR